MERQPYVYLDEEFLASLSEEAREKLRATMRTTVIQLVGDRYPTLHEVGPGIDEQYVALETNLVEMSESLEAMFTHIDAHRERFAFWLVDTGKVSRELMESWWRSYTGEE